MSYLDTSKNYYVYQLRLADCTEPFYIGKGKGNRMYDHFKPSKLQEKNIKNSIIKNAISNNIEVLREKLHENLTEEEAFDLEISYIAMYGRLDKKTGILANHTDGGEGASGFIKTHEQKKKQSEISKRFHSNKTKEQALSFAKLQSEITKSIHSNKTPEEKILLGLKISEGHKKMSTHSKNKWSKKISISLKAKNVLPWNTNCCTELQKQLVWANADKLHQLFLQGYDTKTKLSHPTNIQRDKLQSIVKKFKSGWNPLNDQKWLSEFNPFLTVLSLHNSILMTCFC